jgi:hypothetical protein
MFRPLPYCKRDLDQAASRPCSVARPRESLPLLPLLLTGMAALGGEDLPRDHLETYSNRGVSS